MLQPLLLPDHLEPFAGPLLRHPFPPHKNNLERRRGVTRSPTGHQIPDSIQRPAVPRTPFARNVGEEATDIGTDGGVEKLPVLFRDLRCVDSDAEFEGVDDAPFSSFAVDGLGFVDVDEAGFHGEVVFVPTR